MNHKKMIFFSFLFLLSIIILSAETRTALVIGNGDYDSSPLRNPPNDAYDISNSLESLGFNVTTLINADGIEMKRAIRVFGQELARDANGLGLFYYAGHGMQVNGRNYLIPVGADIQAEDEIQFYAIDTGLVLSKMESAGNRTNVVMLDACRDNPFERSFRSQNRGLAVIDAPKGSLIVYATSPGDVAADGEGRNGVFTGSLLEHMKTPGIDIEFMLRNVRKDVMANTNNQQTPWSTSSLTGSVFLAEKSGTKNEYILSDTKKTQEPVLKIAKSYGSVTFSTKTAGTLFMNDNPLGEIPADGSGSMDNLETGIYTFEMHYDNGEIEKKQVTIEKNKTKSVIFNYQKVKVYSLGDKGPAGGLIFYDKGNSNNGWRYLEAAPALTEWSDKKWGAYNDLVGETSTKIGSGKSNTTAIIYLLNRNNESDKAAQVCSELIYGEYEDWFLPSKDELNLMYENLHKKSLGGFSDSPYWSSAEDDDGYAMLQYFSDGYQASAGKNYGYKVRAVRSF